jgi:transposase
VFDMGKKRKQYPEEFKREAVRLMMARGERTVAEIASDLGVSPKQLYNWRRTYGTEAQRGCNAEGETLEQEVRRLRREVQRLKTDQAILKKAAAFFAKENL